MDGHCETCRWWGNDDHDPNLVRRVCMLTVRDDSQAEHPDSKALTLPSMEHYTALSTAPDFGCVQWEGRETP